MYAWPAYAVGASRQMSIADAVIVIIFTILPLKVSIGTAHHRPTLYHRLSLMPDLSTAAGEQETCGNHCCQKSSYHFLLLFKPLGQHVIYDGRYIETNEPLRSE